MLKGWFRQLFCKHEWKFIGLTVYENGFGERYTKFHYKCKKCGKKVKRKEL